MQRLDLGWDADWCSCWFPTRYLGRGVPQHPEMWCPNCMFLPWDGRCKYSLQLKLSSVAVVGHGLIFIMPVMNSLLLVKMGKSFLRHFYPKAQWGSSGVPVELENTVINPSPLLFSACYGACICRNLGIAMWFTLINALSSGLFTYSCFTVFPR